MGKTFETKRKILDILRQGAKTPTEIGRYLSLSPSTVSQHLKELKESGRIEEFQDEHFKNIKYFRRIENPSIFASSTAKLAIGALSIIVLAVLVASFIGNAPATTASASQPGGTVGIFLTDPPQVPNGTSALIVSYSSLKVQITNSSGTAWKEINGSGTVNLLSLVNFTRNLTAFKLPANSIVDKMSLSIDNATITVNGTAYPVVVSNKNVSVKVFYSGNNSTSFDILFDMFPTVSAVISGNQTIFVMSPSATAATVGKTNNPYYSNHTRGRANALIKLNGDESHILNESRAAITITSASIVASPNGTRVSITVLDNSKYNTTLLGAAIFGNKSYNLDINLSQGGVAQAAMPAGPTKMPRIMAVHEEGISGYLNQSMGSMGSIGSVGSQIANLSHKYGDYGQGIGAQEGMGMPPMPGHIRMELNDSTIEMLVSNLTNRTSNSRISSIIREMGQGDVSANLTGNFVSGKIRDDIRIADYVRSRLAEFRSVNFFISGNATLILPKVLPLPAAIESHKGATPAVSLNPGYHLAPGSSVTLTYNGSLSFANGRISAQFKPGQTYRIMVLGTNGAHAVISVTAT